MTDPLLVWPIRQRADGSPRALSRSAEVDAGPARRRRDRVEEGAADGPGLVAPCAEIGPVGIGDAREVRRLLRRHGRIVELVADEEGPGRPEHAVGGEPRHAVAEVHAPLRETGRDREQPQHRVRGSLGVGQGAAQAPCSRRTRRARAASRRNGAGRRGSGRPRRGPALQFRIAARQPADVGSSPAGPRRRAARTARFQRPAARQAASTCG